MFIKNNYKFKILLKSKLLFADHIFNIKNPSVFYYLYHKNFNKDIWENIFNFLYPSKNQILNWKKEHHSKSHLYINLFKYLYKNSKNLNNKKTEYVINFLKQRYNYLKVVRDLYYLQYKLYQKNIDPTRFKFENNIIKYHSP